MFPTLGRNPSWRAHPVELGQPFKLPCRFRFQTLRPSLLLPSFSASRLFLSLFPLSLLTQAREPPSKPAITTDILPSVYSAHQLGGCVVVVKVSILGFALMNVTCAIPLCRQVACSHNLRLNASILRLPSRLRGSICRPVLTGCSELYSVRVKCVMRKDFTAHPRHIKRPPWPVITKHRPRAPCTPIMDSLHHFTCSNQMATIRSLCNTPSHHPKHPRSG